MIRRRVGDRRSLRRLVRILRDQLAGRVYEDRLFAKHATRILLLLDPLTFTVIEIASNYFRTPFYFGLLVVAVEDECSSRRRGRVDMRDDISVLVTTLQSLRIDSVTKLS